GEGGGSESDRDRMGHLCASRAVSGVAGGAVEDRHGARPAGRGGSDIDGVSGGVDRYAHCVAAWHWEGLDPVATGGGGGVTGRGVEDGDAAGRPRAKVG